MLPLTSSLSVYAKQAGQPAGFVIARPEHFSEGFAKHKLQAKDGPDSYQRVHPKRPTLQLLKSINFRAFI